MMWMLTFSQFQIETAEQNRIIEIVLLANRLVMTNTALLLINFQSARADKDSEYYLPHFEEILPQAQVLLDHARSMGYKVIFVKNIDPLWPFSEKDPNSDFPAPIQPLPSETVIIKRKVSSYYQTFLADELEGIENLIICGFPTNLCVRMAVEESYDRGFRIALIADLCASFSNQAQDFTLEDLYSTRPGLAILSLEEFLQ